MNATIQQININIDNADWHFNPVGYLQLFISLTYMMNLES